MVQQQKDWEMKVDRSHSMLDYQETGGSPATLRWRARDSALLMYDRNPIAICPDYIASVAKSREAFTDVRRHNEVLYRARLALTGAFNQLDCAS